MAKKPVRVKAESTSDVNVKVSKNFIYELQVFAIQKNSYSLKDTVEKSFKEPLDKLRVYHKEKTGYFVDAYTLIAAPETWLNKNNNESS